MRGTLTRAPSKENIVSTMDCRVSKREVGASPCPAMTNRNIGVFDELLVYILANRPAEQFMLA